MTKTYMYYKLGQACVTDWDSFVLLQTRTNIVTNWGSFIITNWCKCRYKLGSYYKLGQPLLQNRAGITNWGKMYYKLGQVLQIRAIITNWGTTTNMSKKQVVLYQWDYMINCNENKNDNGTIDHINKTYIDQGVDIETNIENLACLGKTMSLCIKQHLSKIWGSIH